MALKVAFYGYPMLWQRTGGLQVQMTQTMAALRAQGVGVEMLDLARHKLTDFDLLHVFSAIHGNHLVVESAVARGVPTVLSPVLPPEYTLRLRLGLRLADWLTWKITAGETRTVYGNVRQALHASHHLVALSEGERRAYALVYGVDLAKVSVIGNGVDQAFLTRPSRRFVDEFKLAPGYVLVVGSVCRYKGQLEVVRATAAAGLRVVLLGPVAEPTYLQQCLQEGAGRVLHAGPYAADDERIASAYQHAGVTVLVSAGESFGLAVVESLAAGTPAVVTDLNGLGLPERAGVLHQVRYRDLGALRLAIDQCVSSARKMTGKACRDLVADLDWSRVGVAIAATYTQLVGQQTAKAPLAPAVEQ